MALLRELNGKQEFSVDNTVAVIGRAAGCDVRISLPQVSGRHAVIIRASGSHSIEDLGSRNGTYVNGVRIRQRTRLSVGDCIAIGGRSFIYIKEGTLGDEESMTDSLQATFFGASAQAAEPPSILSSLDAVGDLRVAVAPEAKLRAILEIAKSLGTALDLKDVLPKVLQSLLLLFPQADRGFILLRDIGTGQLVTKAVQQRSQTSDKALMVSKSVVDYVLQTGRAVLSADAGGDQRFGVSESVQVLQLCSIMCVPLLSQGGARLGVIQLDTLDKRRQFSPGDLDVLVCAGTQAAKAVELAQLHQELRDLETATQIQTSFLPEKRPDIEGLHFFDYYSPARHVGGDYFDYIPLPGNRLAVTLGDVTGKGVPAALLMARLSLAAQSCLTTATSVPEAVRQLSGLLTRSGTQDRFVTFVVAVLDLSRFTITLVNAGHMPPIRREGTAKAEDVFEEIAGLPLAVLDRPYKEAVFPFQPGETIVLYTDGVTEARNPAGEFYGNERLRAVIERAPANVEGLGKAILADIQLFAGDRPQSDDLTLVCFSRQH